MKTKAAADGVNETVDNPAVLLKAEPKGLENI